MQSEFMREYLSKQGQQSEGEVAKTTTSEDSKLAESANNPITSGNSRKIITIVDDLGDEIQEELNLEDEESLKDIVAARHKLKHTMSELELMKAQLEALGKTQSEKDARISKLLSALEMGEEAALDVILESKGGFKKVLEEEIKAREAYAKLSAKEREAYDSALREKDINEKHKKMLADLEAKEKAIKDRELAAQNEAELLLYRSAASKYCPPVTDNPDLHKIHGVIFEEAKRELVALKKNGVKLTTAIVEQKFAQAYKNNRSLVQAIKPGSKPSAADTITKATQAATNAAAATSTTATHGQSSSTEELEAKWDKLVAEGKLSSVIKEAQQHSERFAAYVAKKTGKKF